MSPSIRSPELRPGRVLAPVAVLLSLALSASAARAEGSPADTAAAPPQDPTEVPVAPAAEPPAPVPGTAPAPVVMPPAPETAARKASESSAIVHGGYLGPDTKITSLTGDTALLVGGQGGWVVDHSFVLGGAVYALASNVSSPAALQNPALPEASLSLAYGGVRASFVPAATRTVHVFFGVLGGGGRIDSATAGIHRVGDGFFVLEPDAGVEVALGAPLRLAAGASYRITSGTDLPGLGGASLDGPAAFLTIKLGRF